MRQLATPAVNSERCFRCTTAGTSAGTEATWTLTVGSTTTQGTAIFTEVTGNEAYQTPGAWAAPGARLQSIPSVAANDNVYVAANHAETSTAAITFASINASNVICIDNSASGHVPPLSADLRTTATITQAGSFTTTTLGPSGGYIYGLNIVAGGTSCAISLGPAAGGGSETTFENCFFTFTSSGNFNIGTSTTVDLINCQWTPFATSQVVTLGSSATLRWRNTSVAPVGGSIVCTQVFNDGNASRIFCDGLDFSAVAYVKILNSQNTTASSLFVGCKINAATLLAVEAAGGHSLAGSDEFIGCDSGGATYRTEIYRYTGTLTTETAIIHTGGASDGTTGISYKVVLKSIATPWQSEYFEHPPIAAWNSATGSGKVVSFETIANSAAILKNDQVWMDVFYLGTASSAKLSKATSTKTDVLATGSNNTASTASWDSLATARANSHTYALGDAIKLATNTGRVFFCTQAGASAASEPAGYATAVDGGAVTDNAAIFRAGWRMTISLTVTPQVAGLIRVVPKLSAASTTVYIDPKLTIA